MEGSGSEDHLGLSRRRNGWGASNACEIGFSFCLLNSGDVKQVEGLPAESSLLVERDMPLVGWLVYRWGLVSSSTIGRVMKRICRN